LAGNKLGRGWNLGTNVEWSWGVATQGKCLLHSVQECQE